MAREYFKVFGSYLESIKPLNNAARGRLFTALLTYHLTGEVPKFTGNEKYIFPTMKQNMDRDIEAYENVVRACRINGQKGGRPKEKNTENPTTESTEKTKKTNSLFFGAKKSQDKDKDKDELSQKESDKRKSAPRFSPPTLKEIEDFCSENGLQSDPADFFDYYTANGWMMGKNHVRDWQAALRRWERKVNSAPAPREAVESHATPFPSSFDTDDFFEAALAASFREAEKLTRE
ncbi:MAG: hypothetical protein IKV40_06615 [Clostridia bacterium]|nr:hypothetical protein [Clostridia bacterium]